MEDKYKYKHMDINIHTEHISNSGIVRGDQERRERE
jgi:hypothetical protein